MGGKRKSRPKKKKTKVQQAAAKRHANFKKTGVQTHGGTKKKYSKAEARKIEKAGLSFSKVTGGAANPLNRAPSTEGVKAGDLVQPVKDFSESLGLDYSAFAAPQVNYNFNQRSPSDISFSDAVRSGARFNEAGRNELGGGRNVASAFSSGSGLLGRDIDVGDGVFRTPEQIKKMYLNPGNFNLQPGDRLFKQIQEAGKGLVNKSTDGTQTAFLNRFFNKSLVPNAAEKGKNYLEGVRDTNAADDTKGLQNMFKYFKTRDEMLDKDQSSTGISNMSNLVASTNLAGLGMTPKTTSYDPESTAYALRTGDFDPASYEKFKASQQTAGGLNIGGLSAEESNRLGRVFQQTSSPRMLSEGGDLRMSDMFEADTQGAKISKGINTIKNKIPLLNMLPDMKINTVAEEAQRRYLGYNPNLPASGLARMDRRGGGGTRLPMTPTVAQEVSPQTQPVPSASTTPTTQTGVDPNRLLQIQQQAYAQAYNPMLIGGFNPQFRFGGATPTIDYSSYFNY